MSATIDTHEGLLLLRTKAFSGRRGAMIRRTARRVKCAFYIACGGTRAVPMWSWRRLFLYIDDGPMQDHVPQHWVEMHHAQLAEAPLGLNVYVAAYFH